MHLGSNFYDTVTIDAKSGRLTIKKEEKIFITWCGCYRAERMYIRIKLVMRFYIYVRTSQNTTTLAIM